jgi:hypothetical protein
MFLLGSTDLEALSNIGGKLFCEFPLFSSSCSQIAKTPPVPWVPLYYCPLLGLREWKFSLFQEEVVGPILPCVYLLEKFGSQVY